MSTIGFDINQSATYGTMLGNLWDTTFSKTREQQYVPMNTTWFLDQIKWQDDTPKKSTLTYTQDKPHS